MHTYRHTHIYIYIIARIVLSLARVYIIIFIYTYIYYNIHTHYIYIYIYMYYMYIYIIYINRIGSRGPKHRGLTFIRYCYYLYCIVYGIHTGVRRGGRMLPNSRSIVLQQGGQCRWSRGMQGWLIRAQKLWSKRISCKSQIAGKDDKFTPTKHRTPPRGVNPWARLARWARASQVWVPKKLIYTYIFLIHL